MAGKIIADQIEHSTAGSLDTSYVVNGSAKAWIHQADNANIRDSLNIASLTDVSAGKGENNFSNNFSSAYYSSGGSHNYNAVGNNMFAAFENAETHVPSTSSKSIDSIFDGSSFVDVSTIVHQCFGDLA